MVSEKKMYNKNILIAVDETEESRRAVTYVAQIIGGVKGFKIAVLNVIAEPEEDYFPTAAEKEQWLKEHSEKIDTTLKEYRQILIDAGFDENDVLTKSTLRYCPSMAECIITEWDKTAYDTLVVGRKGLSRKEEFLFGSVSSKVVNLARNYTVWVVS
jgi:nucleotide-binding universal stress UspA family protein